MKALVIGDLHYPYEYRFFMFKKLLQIQDPDLIFICGDVANIGYDLLIKKLLEEIHEITSARIIAVMGNHDFWLNTSLNDTAHTSWHNITIYQRIFNRYKDVILWKKPFLIDNTAIVGVPGWFDFSFAVWHHGFARDDFLRGTYDRNIWNDVVYTKFIISPEEVTRIHVQLLERQLNSVIEMGLEQIIVLLHFVPLRDFVPKHNDKEKAFWSAYYGSELLGEAILKFKEYISQVFFGHLSPKYLTYKKVVKGGIPFETVDITENIKDSRLITI